MDVCGLPKARPISCNDCPAFQRRHTSVLCAAESPTRFPWLINTTFEEKIHIRWCCIDLLRPHALSDMWFWDDSTCPVCAFIGHRVHLPVGHPVPAAIRHLSSDRAELVGSGGGR